jgi:acetyl esterase
VVVAGHDPLHDEGLRFADKLAAAGVPVTTAEAPALAHGFIRAAPYVDAARDAVAAMAKAATRALKP